MPEGWSVRSERAPGDQATLVAFLETPLRELYRVRGKVIVTGNGGTWQVRTAQADADETDLRWGGNPVWEEFIDPPQGFCGRPTLYDAIRKIPEQALVWRPANNGGLLGPATAIWSEKGEERHRARMVILPPKAEVRLLPKGLDGGDIRLERWQAAGARLTAGQPVAMESIREADALLLRFTPPQQSPSQPAPPEFIDVEVLWAGNPTPARIRFPFPAQGVRAFDGQGRELVHDGWLPVHPLTGVRLTAVGITTRLELRLTLQRPKDPLHDGVESRHAIQRMPGTYRVEIRLQDFADSIERLFSADDLLDAWVKATVWGDHDELFVLRLSRYLCLLERAAPDVRLTQKGLRRIDPTALANLPVLALRLETPGDEPIRLEARASEGVASGAWTFATKEREPGSWFIYPGPEAEERFRPTLWTLQGEYPAASPLTQALAVEQRHERAAALDRAIAAMAADYQESCWPELERLAGHLGHLPLVSFDLWRRFAHSPAGMAALALRLPLGDLPADFVGRFAVELPFAWELVPYGVWREAAGRLRRQCVGWFGEAAAESEMRKALETSQESRRQATPALSKLLGILRSAVLGEECKEVRMMKCPANDGVFREQLFGRENSTIQKLLRGHAEDDWPNDNAIFRWVDMGRTQCNSGATLFCAEHPNFRDGLINLPILLALQVATDTSEAWFEHPERIHRLRTYRAFDPEWFEEAFDLTIARCLSLGLLKP